MLLNFLYGKYSGYYVSVVESNQTINTVRDCSRLWIGSFVLMDQMKTLIARWTNSNEYCKIRKRMSWNTSTDSLSCTCCTGIIFPIKIENMIVNRLDQRITETMRAKMSSGTKLAQLFDRERKQGDTIRNIYNCVGSSLRRHQPLTPPSLRCI